MHGRYSFRYSRSTNRRNSLLSVTDPVTGSLYDYEFNALLGSGSYGRVRLFKSEHLKLAIKSALINIGATAFKTVKEVQEEIENEFRMMSQAYPHDFYFLEIYLDYQSSHGKSIDYRMVMPFVRGEVLHQFFGTIQSRDELAKLFLRIAQELSRIHELGILHGDPNPGNLMIHKTKADYHVRFVDFGMAYRRHEYSCLPLLLPGGVLAPERFTNKPIKAHRSQDVYALASLFNLSFNVSIKIDYAFFIEKYPSMAEFTNKGLKKNRRERPRLSSFIGSIFKELISGSLPPDTHPEMMELYDALARGNIERIQLALEGLRDEHYEKRMNLLDRLINVPLYPEISLILAANNEFLHPLPTSALKQFVLDAIQIEDCPKYLLRDLFNFGLPKDSIVPILTQPFDHGQTILHIAVLNRRYDLLSMMVYALAREKPASLAWKLDISEYPENRTTLIIVVDLALYMHGLSENQRVKPNHSGQMFKSRERFNQLFNVTQRLIYMMSRDTDLINDPGYLLSEAELRIIKKDDTLSELFDRMRQLSRERFQTITP